MDGKGRCIDNIFIERLWWSLKYECVCGAHSKTCRHRSIQTSLLRRVGYSKPNDHRLFFALQDDFDRLPDRGSSILAHVHATVSA